MGVWHRHSVTTAERAAFLSAAEEAPREVRTLCGLLAHTGCRLSEALWLTADRVDLRADLVVFETLKKRRSGVYRAVPVPHTLVDMLDLVHGLQRLQGRSARGRSHRLWSWSRMTGWRRVCEVMARAGVRGPQGSPKGLRHGFGVAAVTAGVTLNLVHKWLGHAQLSTTAIYADAVGEEDMPSRRGCGRGRQSTTPPPAWLRAAHARAGPAGRFHVRKSEDERRVLTNADLRTAGVGAGRREKPMALRGVPQGDPEARAISRPQPCTPSRWAASRNVEQCVARIRWLQSGVSPPSCGVDHVRIGGLITAHSCTGLSIAPNDKLRYSERSTWLCRLLGAGRRTGRCGGASGRLHGAVASAH